MSHGNIGLFVVDTPARIPASPGMGDWQKRLQGVGCCVFSPSDLTMADFQLSGALIWFMEGSLETSSPHGQDKLNTDRTLDQGYLGTLSSS